MSMARKRTLEPCPFCGGKATVLECLGKEYIDCEHTSRCLIRPNTWLSCERPLIIQIRAWNKRAVENR